MDSARGVAAIVVCCRNSSCNISCDAIARDGRTAIAFFLLFRVQSFVCNRVCEGMFQTCFKCGHRNPKYCSLTPCRFHPFSKQPSYAHSEVYEFLSPTQIRVPEVPDPFCRNPSLIVTIGPSRILHNSFPWNFL